MVFLPGLVFARFTAEHNLRHGNIVSHISDNDNNNDDDELFKNLLKKILIFKMYYCVEMFYNNDTKITNNKT
jgi:uncharacterized sporulation protein YeaH/YhbH (DUF444 family)